MIQFPPVDDVLYIPFLGNFEREMVMKIGNYYDIESINCDSFLQHESELLIISTIQ